VASSGTAVCAAPRDYTELFLQYGDEIRRVVWRKMGPAAQRADVDDGVSYIIQQFIKNDVLKQYKPDHVSNFNGRYVTFKAFMLSKVPLYCRGLREALTRTQGREPLVLDVSVGDSGDMSYGEASGLFSVTDEYPSLAADAGMLARLHDALAAREAEPGCTPVLPLFEALSRQFATGKTVSAAAVRRQFGLGREEAEAWLVQLQEALREVAALQLAEVSAVAEEPEPEFREDYETTGGGFWLGGLTLTADEVRAAAAALKVSTTNRVLPAFKNTRHRLAGAGKTWYLDFAEQVMQAHPELRTPKGGHYPGGHFGRVKNALIFGLDLLAAPLPEVLEEPETVPDVVQEAELTVAAAALDTALWANLEAALGQIPGCTGDTLDAALEAVRLLVPV
jgi:hypothetical protein